MDLKEAPAGQFVRHPWEVARCAFVDGIFERYVRVPADGVMLDVGSGDAWLASQVVYSRPEIRRCVCWDLGYGDGVDGDAFSDSRLVPLATAPAEEFDVILALDVLEHVEDDRAFLERVVRRNMRSGSCMIFSVPAWPALMTSHDDALGHFRRYTPAQAREAIVKSGLRIEASGGLFSSLLPVRAAAALRQCVAGRPDRIDVPRLEWLHSVRLRDMVAAALLADARCGAWLSRRGLELPGLSWWALCRL